MKFCKDCRWCRELVPGAGADLFVCTHPAAVRRHLDLVTGEERASSPQCRHERELGKCGMDGKNFEPKQP